MIGPGPPAGPGGPGHGSPEKPGPGPVNLKPVGIVPVSTFKIAKLTHWSPAASDYLLVAEAPHAARAPPDSQGSWLSTAARRLARRPADPPEPAWPVSLGPPSGPHRAEHATGGVTGGEHGSGN